MEHKRILIVAYHFYPQNTPRAFRTYELAKELARQGHAVDLILPQKDIFIENNVHIDNLRKFYIGEKISNEVSVQPGNNIRKGAGLKQLFRSFYWYLNPFGKSVSYIRQLYNYLLTINEKYDYLISISSPYSIHLATGLAIRKSKKLAAIPIKIAEYSDPFYDPAVLRVFWGYKYLDIWNSKAFDYIVVPTEKACSSYKKHKSAGHIKVIPQGFDFGNITVCDYQKNAIPSFAYAGVFYDKIRNPEVFFNYLKSVSEVFKFYIFTSPSNTDTLKIINKYRDILKDKLVVEYNVPRLQLIERLSGMDFLINIDNITTHHSPSKLIDYALTTRPVFSFNQNYFDEKKFQSFFCGQYEAFEFPLEKYDIRNIVRQFLNIKQP